MSDKAQTPLQEFMAERTAEIEAGIALPGSEGAFYRLLKKMDPIMVSEWITEESARDTPTQELADALGNFLANAITPLTVPKGKFCRQAAAYIFQAAMNAFEAMVSGDGGTDGLLINRSDGRVVQVTVAGVAQNGVPE